MWKNQEVAEVSAVIMGADAPATLDLRKNPRWGVVQPENTIKVNQRFDPNQIAFMEPQTGGACRAGNYYNFIIESLKRAGYSQIPVISLNAFGKDKHAGFTITPKHIRFSPIENEHLELFLQEQGCAYRMGGFVNYAIYIVDSEREDQRDFVMPDGWF